MKKFFMGMLFGILISGTALCMQPCFGKIEKCIYPIYANCKRLNFKNDVLSVDDVTYVPLREFCEQTEVYIDFMDKSRFENGTQKHNFSEEQPVSYINVIEPFVQNRIQTAVCPENISFFSDEIENELNTPEKITINSHEQAVSMGAEILKNKYGNDVFNTILYTSVYLEKYDAYFIICNQPPNAGKYYGSEYSRAVVIKSNGTLIKTFKDTGGIFSLDGLKFMENNLNEDMIREIDCEYKKR